MKYTKIILAGILALTLTACADTNTAEDTTLMLETTSETVMTEETTTATTIEVEVESEVPIISDDVFVHATEEAEETEEKVEETTKPAYLVEFLATATTTEAEELEYLATDVPVTKFSTTKSGYREYATSLSDDAVFVEPNEADTSLLNEAVEILKTDERFAEFLNWEEHNQLAAPGYPPFVMDGYLNDDNTAKPQLKWVLETDMNYDGKNEFFLVVSTAPYFTEVGGTNEYLLYKDSTGNFEVLNQTCGVVFNEIYDFTGLCRCVSLEVGTNGETHNCFLYGVGDITEYIENRYGFIEDTETSRIYLSEYQYGDAVKCLVMDSVTQRFEKYFIPSEEFMEFYEAFH